MDYRKGQKMNATETMIEVLDVTEAQAIEVQNLMGTTYDGSKWDEASYRQIIITAQYVLKAIAKAAA
jgi:hypothetical protein